MTLTGYNYRKVIELYGDHPITFIKLIAPSMKWPKKIRVAFARLWKRKTRPNIIMTGPRGGGKSYLLGALVFAEWFFRQRSVVDMAGSMNQAKVVYGYFIDMVQSDPVIQSSLDDDPRIEKTTGKDGNYVTVLAASTRGARSHHPDVLALDEVCEIDDEIVQAAMPMVDTSEDPIRIMTSTFHRIFGSFQETWDNAEELGWTRFQWDIFDVAKQFDPSVWDDPTFNAEIPDLAKLKELAAGRTGDPEGWVPIKNIINDWRAKPTLDWFLVEYMGSRPSASGLINDPIDVEAAQYDPAKETGWGYVPGAEVVGGIDWGFSSMTSWGAFQRCGDDVKSQLVGRHYIQTLSHVIVGHIVADVKKYKIQVIYADSAGKFENAELQAALDKGNVSCKVVERKFSTEKEEMLGNYRAHFQRRKIKIPITEKVALWQHKRYRYQDGSDKPRKKDDHYPDMTMCALSHWPMGQFNRTIADLVIVKGESQRKTY